MQLRRVCGVAARFLRAYSEFSCLGRELRDFTEKTTTGSGCIRPATQQKQPGRSRLVRLRRNSAACLMQLTACTRILKDLNLCSGGIDIRHQSMGR